MTKQENRFIVQSTGEGFVLLDNDGQQYTIERLTRLIAEAYSRAYQEFYARIVEEERKKYQEGGHDL